MSTVTPLKPQSAKPTDAEVAELKKKWGDVLYLRVADAAIIVRQFTEAEWDRFQLAVERNQAVNATKDLLSVCTVWSSEPLDAIVSRRPAYGKKFAMSLIEWAGAGDQLEKKEL